jgi:1A family penicillin-binding protein
MDFRLRSRLDELRRQWQHARELHPRIAIGVVAAFILVATLSCVGGVRFLIDLHTGLPDLDALRHIGNMEQATAVYDDKDQLAFTVFTQERIFVPLDEVSPNLLHAIVAIEDQRFYGHGGFDLIRMGSATLVNIRQGRKAQGGSTITQQLARQSFLSTDKSFRRKFQELILAGRIEAMYSKPQILEMYLNKVYFGDGLYGIEAASRGYFGKHASELSVSEAALLAGLVKSPSSYAPTVSRERATVRRNVVLQAMLDSGAINRATWQSARAEKIALHDTLRAQEPHGQYFKEQVRQELVSRFGWQRVYQGGLRIFTTLDMPMQIAAEAAVAEQLKSIEDRRAAWQARLAAARAKNAKTPQDAKRAMSPPAGDNVLQAALVALDPNSGSVRAMVGGRDFDGSHFNRAVQAHRQPGSAFKPFVYATAIEAGYSPSSIIDRLDEPIQTGRGVWTPEDEHSTGSSMTLRTGLRTSSNRAAVRLLQEVGIARTVQYAKMMGVGDVPAVPSLALGSGEVTLQAMTAAYAAFANHGMVPRPMMIRRVEDQDGLVLYEARESASLAISDTTAFLMSTMMADVINAGTGNRARRLGFTLPAAGKTGTTNDFNDAWFVGFTPKLVTGVWVGFDQPHMILPNGFAADVAVPVWANFMKVATRNDKPEWLTPPQGVVSAKVCKLSGRLATDGCQEYSDYFVYGSEPTTYCNLHTAPGILAEVVNLLATNERPASTSSPRVADTMVPATPPVVEASTSSIQKSEDPSLPPTLKRKHSFWSKIFGVKGHEEPELSNRLESPKKKSGG